MIFLVVRVAPQKQVTVITMPPETVYKALSVGNVPQLLWVYVMFFMESYYLKDFQPSFQKSQYILNMLQSMIQFFITVKVWFPLWRRG